jgi:phosphoserine aminotransferase
MIPSMLDYTKHIKAKVCTTHLLFPVYASLTLQWLKNLGGIAAIENKQCKSSITYTEIDRNPCLKRCSC